MNKYIYSIVFLLLFSGCSGEMNQLATPNLNNTPQQTNTNSIANWVLKPKSSNSEYFYAVGEGQNKDEARKNGLGQIAGQISITISSNTLTTKKVTNDIYEKNIESNIKASTQNIKFTGVNSLDTTFANGVFYEYLQVDKKILFDSLKKDFDINYKNINNNWKSIKIGSPFLVFRKGVILEDNILKAIATTSILKSINKNFDQNSYIKTLQDIDSNYKKKRSGIKVIVESNSAKNEKIVLQKALSDYGIKVISSTKNHNDKQNILKIVIDKTAKEAPNTSKSLKLQDVKYADIKLVIITYDINKKIKLAQNILNLKNGSRVSYNAAVIKTKKFEREIQEQGILKILLENI